MADDQAFLGVSYSVNGCRWVSPPCDERLAGFFAQKFGVPEIVGRIMASRGITPETAPHFLKPTLKSLLPDPAHLKDMDVAVSRLIQAVRDGETIAIFGDYDVDGATSSALLYRFLTQLGGKAFMYIPDRQDEGYGPTVPAMEHLKEKGASLLVTVDCGTTSFEPLERAAELGMDVIVVDHHEAEPRLPKAIAVINPKRLDELSTHRYLAAVGVTFLLVVGLNRALRELGWYKEEGRREPDLMRYLDIVALGTVCDVVPLTGVNRAFVARGLDYMALRSNPGLVALGDIAGIDERPRPYHLGFLLGPRINAGGRVGDSALGATLLASDNPEEVTQIAERLDALNGERKEIEAGILEEAIEEVESCEEERAFAFTCGKGWHEGVLGIIASRLKERYNLPAFVMAQDEKGIIKGSARSVVGIDLGAIVIAARQAGVLTKGGGHTMAAGFSLNEDKLEAFKNFIAERIDSQLGGEALVPVLEVDAAISLRGATVDLVSQLSLLEPFGVGNRRPRFVIPDVRITKSDIVGQGHVRCFLTTAGGGSLKAIAFRAADSDLGQILLSPPTTPVHIAGDLRLDTWRGRNAVQCQIVDVARANHAPDLSVITGGAG